LLIFLVVLCVIFGGILFVVFTGVMSEDGERFSLGDGIPRMKELPPGCLVALIVAGSIWFILWGIVLLLALRLLRTPLGN
jgi:TRAP-type C4-dicarboxylate transport system permease small subunit